MTEQTRPLSELRPGDRHYMAYVGPPLQYDFMGATQFRLLCTLGLRAHHRLLDFGCGSLRAGRLFISYLDRGNYFGIEPNQWLIEDSTQNQIGADMLRIKAPRFAHNSDFRSDVFSEQFDFIIAQSIFTHCGPELIQRALGNFRESLLPGGLIAASFVEARSDSTGTGWVYPECLGYRKRTILGFARAAGLRALRIPWYNPRVGWYLMAEQRRRLPNAAMSRHLTGAVLFDPEFTGSWRRHHETLLAARRVAGRVLPDPVKGLIKQLIRK